MGERVGRRAWPTLASDGSLMPILVLRTERVVGVPGGEGPHTRTVMIDEL